MTRKKTEYVEPVALPLDELMAKVTRMYAEQEQLSRVVESPEFAELNPGDFGLVQDYLASLQREMVLFAQGLHGLDRKRAFAETWLDRLNRLEGAA